MRFSFPLDRSLLSPPGDTIQETIDALGMTQAELAQRMGRPKEKINELIKGKAPLSMDTAGEVSFRISLKNTPNPGAIAVWLRIGEKEARALPMPAYNEKGFRAAMRDFRAIAKEQADDFLIQMQSLAAKNGVALVFTPSFPKVRISGAARWVGATPLIQLSDLYKTNDQFWFSFFHEACHILEHGKKDRLFTTT